ncbi:DUF885 family protein [Belliella kenyensis]|uniref:DUF885 family protein n=1 Tax=Belliella kenyensis TaxID=1472724 RepID=A0ABV8EMN0_9BACT|nr:DUF885 family protein [Belliella kenyensis]MCH7400517.1 DUF885 domain-containing protein [Belliella kenyensis]MDN3604467.1 DUF885 family protein [Belliella kenyensis]
MKKQLLKITSFWKTYFGPKKSHPVVYLSLFCKKSIAVFLTVIITSTIGIAQGLYSEASSYVADVGTLHRKYTNRNSHEYFNRINLHYEQWLEKLRGLDFGSLDKDAQIDYLIFKNKLEKDQFFHNQAFETFKEVAHVAPFSPQLEKFYIPRRKGTKPNAEKLAGEFKAVTTEIKKLHESLSKTDPFNSWQKAELASDVIKSLQRSVTEAYGFYYDYDPAFTWWMKTPFEELDKAMTAYAAFLKDHYQNTLVKDDGSGIIGKPIGKVALEKELAFEFIPYTPEELIREAEKQFAWCEEEMLKASEELGYGKDWKAAIEFVKNTYVEPGTWPQDIHFLAEEAIDFLEERDLLTIPDLAKETWRMTMMSPESQRINPFFLGGEAIQISYPTSTMSHEEKMMSMRGNNPHFSRATVQHELIPGHHLQGYMTQRHRPYRSLFSTPFWIEGWALYWEIALWDKSFPKSAEDKVGMLFWRMHRCARIIFSLNYHLEKMSPQQAIDFLVDKVGHERANAEAEVRRSFEGRYGPLYQIAYMIGGLQLYALKGELVDNGSMSEKDFHDQILQNNSIPIEILRIALKDNAVDKNYKTNWKFLKDLDIPHR